MKREYKQLEAFKVEFNANEQVAAGACLIAMNLDGTKYQYGGWIKICDDTTMGKYANIDYVDTETCIITSDSDINQYYQ